VLFVFFFAPPTATAGEEWQCSLNTSGTSSGLVSDRQGVSSQLLHRLWILAEGFKMGLCAPGLDEGFKSWAYLLHTHTHRCSALTHTISWDRRIDHTVQQNTLAVTCCRLCVALPIHCCGGIHQFSYTNTLGQIT